MDTKNFTSLEAAFLNEFNRGSKTYEALIEKVGFNENTMKTVIESLQSKNVINFNTTTREYEYSTPVVGEKIILDGNIFLPITIIKLPNKMLITRGAWYEFPLDFDSRRIIWNVVLPNSNNSTLVELIRDSVLKDKKSRIVQLPEYKQLCNKIIPYSKTLGLLINVVGADVTDVTMLFKIPITVSADSSDFIEYKGFNVRSEIKTSELIEILSAEVKDFSKISIAKLFKFSDFIYSNNEIPFHIEKSKISYAKITAIRGKIELTYFDIDNTGSKRKVDTNEFLEVSEGIEKLRELFLSCCQTILDRDGIFAEMEE